MTLQEALNTLRRHNEWRRYDGPIGEGPKMADPTELGEAIDTVVARALPTIEDMKMVIAAEGSIYDEHNNDKDAIFAKYDTEEKFYSEVLRRYTEIRKRYENSKATTNH